MTLVLKMPSTGTEELVPKRTLTPDGKPAILISEAHFDWIMKTGPDSTKLRESASKSVGESYENFGSADCDEGGL